MGDDHLVTYQCMKSEFLKDGNCEPRSEHVEIYSRRRGLNTEQRDKLLDLAAEKTCFGQQEFIVYQHNGVLAETSIIRGLLT